MVWDRNSHSVLPYRQIFLTITVSWEDYHSKPKTSLWKERMYKPVYYQNVEYILENGITTNGNLLFPGLHFDHYQSFCQLK